MQKQVRELFAAEFSAATTTKHKTDLADQLLGHAKASSSPVELWTLATESMRLAAEAGDFDQTMAALELLGSKFQFSLLEIKLNAFAKLAPKISAGNAEAFAKASLIAFGEAFATGHHDAATRALAFAAAGARKAGSKELTNHVASLRSSLKEQEKAAKRVQPFLNRLETNPLDEEAALVLIQATLDLRDPR